MRDRLCSDDISVMIYCESSPMDLWSISHGSSIEIIWYHFAKMTPQITLSNTLWLILQKHYTQKEKPKKSDKKQYKQFTHFSLLSLCCFTENASAKKQNVQKNLQKKCKQCKSMCVSLKNCAQSHASCIFSLKSNINCICVTHLKPKKVF